MSIGLSKRWFAWAMLHMAQRYDALLAETKRDLLGSLEGTIVEIGPGTGTNFRYYPRGVHAFHGWVFTPQAIACWRHALLATARGDYHILRMDS